MRYILYLIKIIYRLIVTAYIFLKNITSRKAQVVIFESENVTTLKNK